MPPAGEVQAEARSDGTEALPLSLSRTELSGRIVDSLRKRVMGRGESRRSIERVVRDIAPIIERAARQPVVERAIRQLARDEGMSFEAARLYWIRLHEADILLESGGRPDVVSVSDAVGVSQWLAGTARGVGMRVDERESRRLTGRIDDLKRRIAWREYALHPNADRSAPGWPAGLTRETAAQGLDALRAEREMLRAKRRVIDQRYDPEKAVFAQARYLARLYKTRFPSMDWVYQAYHGGENGATRTLKKYLGGAWPGSTAAAIRRGSRGGRLRFEDVYVATTPRAHPVAFDYLYGRSDDHRHYWWKLRAAEDAIALYRRGEAAFLRAWASYLPGRYMEAVWYPDSHRSGLRLPDLPALDAARRRGELLPVAGVAAITRPAPFAPPQTRASYAALRPESKGLLLLIARTYRQAGGTEPLVIGDMALTEEYVQQARRRYPPKPPKGPLWPPDPEENSLPRGGPPEGFDYHTTGLAFDLRKPVKAAQRKRLDYALGYLEDRRILYRTEKTDEKDRSPGWHIVPSPRYAAALREQVTGHRGQ